jgi:hypothetical protein
MTMRSWRAPLALAVAAGLALTGLAAAAPAGAAAKTSTLTGTVLTAKGKAAKGGFAELYLDWKTAFPGDAKSRADFTPIDKLLVKAVPLAKDGTYRFTGLKPGAKYTVAAYAAGHLQTWLGGKAGNAPRWTSAKSAKVTAAAAGATATARNIKLKAGGAAVKGKIAGYKKSAKGTVAAYYANETVSLRQAIGSAAKAKPFKSYYSDDAEVPFRGYVFSDGSYLIPGLPPVVVGVRAANASGLRTAVTAVPAKGSVKANLKKLPSGRLIDGKSVALEYSGYYAPGYTIDVRAVPDPLMAGDAPSVTFTWLDPARRSVIGTGTSLKVTDAMIGTRPWLVARLDYGSADADLIETCPMAQDETIAAVPVSRVLGFATPLRPGLTATAAAPPAGWVYAYQWTLDGVAVPGATGRSWTPALADANGESESDLALTVTATGPGGRTGAVKATSDIHADPAQLEPLTSPVDSTAPGISGQPAVGQTLTALNAPAAWSPAFQWKRGYGDKAKSIAGATSATYTVAAADQGQAISVTVTGQRTGYWSYDAESAPVYVGPVKPAVTVKLPKKTVKTSARAKVGITVAIPGVDDSGITGSVKLKYGSKTIAVKKGFTKWDAKQIKLPKLKKGTYKIRATYTGPAGVTATTSKTVKLKVK